MDGAAAHGDEDLHVGVQLGEDGGGGRFIGVEVFRVQDDFLGSLGADKVFCVVGILVIDGGAFPGEAGIIQVLVKIFEAAGLNDG